MWDNRLLVDFYTMCLSLMGHFMFRFPRHALHALSTHCTYAPAPRLAYCTRTVNLNYFGSRRHRSVFLFTVSFVHTVSCADLSGRQKDRKTERTHRRGLMAAFSPTLQLGYLQIQQMPQRQQQQMLSEAVRRDSSRCNSNSTSTLRTAYRNESRTPCALKSISPTPRALGAPPCPEERLPEVLLLLLLLCVEVECVA